MLKEETKQDILDLTNEFKKTNGKITAEYSLHRDDIFEFLDYVRWLDNPYGKWYISQCDTCEEYYGKDYVHVEIIKWEE